MAAIICRRRRERRDRPIPRIFRDRTHPLDHFDDTEIYAKFRFRRNDILEICDATNGRLERPNRTGIIPPVLQILTGPALLRLRHISRCVRRVDRRPPDDSVSRDQSRDASAATASRCLDTISSAGRRRSQQGEVL